MAINAPEGTRDLLPDEALFWNQFKQTAAEVFGAYGYLPIETPIMEQTELFVRGIGEATDVVSKEMFTAISGENLRRWVEEGKAPKAKSRLSLRPEGTAGVVRAVVQHDLVPQGAAPAKLMYAGPMFRAERPQKGRQRQFNQVGVECLGAEEPTIDAEAIIMLMRFYEKAGIPRDSMRLLLNSMGCEQCRPAYRELVRAYMDEHLKAYLGVEKVIWVKEGIDPEETNGHIDDVATFIAPGVVAVIWTDDPDYPFYRQCHEAYDTLAAATDAKGRQLKVYKLPMPVKPLYMDQTSCDTIDVDENAEPRVADEPLIASYMNYLVTNGGVIVPRYGDENDVLAVQTLQEIYDEVWGAGAYKCVGVQSEQVVFGGGNIHCITQQQPKPQRK